MAKFFTYRQANIYGHYEVNDNLDVLVVIEANDYQQANDIAERVGIYFNGCETGIDCDCCGDRWQPQDEYDDEDATSMPTYYDVPVDRCVEKGRYIIHYLDGSKVRSRK